jgi:N-acetylglucosaminyl-diphospho-decaprenol L-rhamnosyltransferase
LTGSGKKSPLPVFAVVVNFRTAEMTIDAVQSLFASDLEGIDLDVLIVDNGSGDGSSELLQATFPNRRHFSTTRNLGYAGGNNVALRALLSSLPPEIDPEHSYVLLLNSDVIVEPDALTTCVDYLEHHPDVAIVGPRVVLPDGSLDLACRRSFPTPASGFWKLTGLARRFPHSARLTRYNLTYLDEHETTEVDSVMGAFMLMRLQAILHAGILDERFFFYGEDLDWAYRIKAHGWKIVYYPRALVHHLKGGTSRRNSSRMIIEFYRAMWLFYRKHYAKRRVLLLDWVVLAGIVARGLLALGINALRPADRKRVA